jgi:hypothetical protein
LSKLERIFNKWIADGKVVKERIEKEAGSQK